MGGIADEFARYIQPLLDQTDGSKEESKRAFALGQICWNLALLPEGERAAGVDEMQVTLKMDDEEFSGFRQEIVVPMIKRYHEMFPGKSRLDVKDAADAEDVAPSRPFKPVCVEKYPGTGRNEPCPCKSGRKYKRCCGG